ncbi:MAG: hypothetical protein KJN90_14975, partial [Gammaproteobacteria bacterium]|nr:hypothetical protein [Gammaproteobacteria bacterium]
MKKPLKAVFQITLTGITAAMLLACSPAEQQEAASDTAVSYNTSLPMAQLMTMVLEPAADSLWDNAGWIESAAGYEELYPTTDEGWDFMVAQSALVAESGNLLALPGRAIDDAAWLIYSEGMIDAGMMAMDAAQRRHEEDFFQAGAQLY